MDPVSAVSLAAAIVQFVDFSWRLLSTTQSIHSSATGLTREHEDLNDIANNVIKLDKNLIAAAAPGAIPDSLRVLSCHCREVGEELRKILGSLQVLYPHKKWKSFVQALQSIYKKDRIENLAQRLDRLKADMHLQISLVLCAETSDIYQKLSTLISENKRLAMNNAQQLEDQVEGVHQVLAEVQLEIVNSKSAVTDAIRSIESSDSSTSCILPRSSGCVQELSEKLPLLATDVSVTASNHQLLSSLWFPAMGEREENVAIAYEKTFSWIFSPDSPSRFEAWLRKQNGIYWLMGKAGSGKSTLMKFLLNHPETNRLLKDWAGYQKLIVTSVFLWHTGTTLQKSREGLYRSLLFEILHQCPDMIQSVCASKTKAFRPYENNFTAWKLTELSQALREVQHQSGTKTRFCFFIDGLDEYDGEPDEIVEVLESLASWDMVKICASSRPWNEFIDAFGRPNGLQLALESLTRHDIEIYVQEMLGRNARFKDLSSRDEHGQKLVLEIVQKSRGVFLWVELVTRSLLTGLRNADRIADLQRRLRDFPPTLEEYFMKIFKSVEPIYRQQTTETLKLALEARKPLSLTAYSLLDEESLDQALSSETTSFTSEELLERHDTMRRRLNGRSKGFLEVGSGKGPGIADLILWPKVDFLHRTAYDFLLTPELQQMLNEGVRPNFNPSICFIKALCLQVQKVPMAMAQFAFVGFIIYDIARYAFQLEQKSCHDHFPLLDKILLIPSNIRTLKLFMISRLYQYITHVLKRRTSTSKSLENQLLVSSLGFEFKLLSDGLDPKMVSILVEHGASPNADLGTLYPNRTIWEQFLLGVHNRRFQESENRLSAVVTILISHGADMQRKVALGNDSTRSGSERRDLGPYREGTESFQADLVTEYKTPTEILIERLGHVPEAVPLKR